MRISLIPRPTRACIFVLFAAEIFCKLTILPASADATDVARAALLAKARQQCAAAVGLFDRALQEGEFSLKEKGMLIYSRGACYENLGIPQKALADFNSAIALLPDFANAFNYRGIVWGELHEYDRAIADFEQAARLLPSDFLVFNNLGNAFTAKGEFARAIENYSRAVELRPEYAQAYYNRAAAYLSLDDQIHALADYDEAIRLQPTYGIAYSNRGSLNLIRGEVELAISDFDAAVRLNQRDVRALMNRAHAFLVADRQGDALTDFSRVIEIDPGNAAAYLGRGRAALFSNGEPQSIDDLLTAHRLLPTNAYTVLWLHIARTHRGESDDKEFKENAQKVKRDSWPGTLLNLYDEGSSQEDLRRMAAAGSTQERNQRLCEVAFYTAEYAAHHQSKNEAQELLRNAKSKCKKHELGNVAAKAELSLLAR